MQLGQFLGPQVDKVGGMMAMADVYCLFNRARGTELVSPDDLLQACSCFPQAGVPLRIKEFSTGALAVQSQSHSTEQVREHTMQCTVSQ
jgi:ESCRT-II complex subunit VPS36